MSGTLKGVGRVYQQTFITPTARWRSPSCMNRKTPIHPPLTVLTHRVVPFSTTRRQALRILPPRTGFCCTSPVAMNTSSTCTV